MYIENNLKFFFKLASGKETLNFLPSLSKFLSGAYLESHKLGYRYNDLGKILPSGAGDAIARVHTRAFKQIDE
jgi:hypothetical protein